MKTKALLAAIDRLNAAVGKRIVLLVLPIMGIIAYEVTARFVFNKPTIWAFETTSLVFGVMVALLGGYALLHGQHVRVDIVFASLSDRRKAIMDAATSVFGFLFIGALLWYSTVAAVDSVRTREVSETVFSPPVYPLRIILAFGILLLLLQMVAKLVRDIQTVTRGNDDSLGARREAK